MEGGEVLVGRALVRGGGGGGLWLREGLSSVGRDTDVRVKAQKATARGRRQK